MTTDHEHPQYVTKADLQAFEGRFTNRSVEMELRLNNRSVEMELRLVRDFHAEFRSQFRWTVGLILPLYALLVAVILTVAIAGTNILARLPS